MIDEIFIPVIEKTIKTRVIRPIHKEVMLLKTNKDFKSFSETVTFLMEFYNENKQTKED